MSMESTKNWKQRLVPPIFGATASVAIGARLIGSGTQFEVICGILLVGGSTLVIIGCGFEVMSRLRKERAK